MNAVRHRSIAVVILAAVFFAAGCSKSVQVMGERVKDPDQFLERVEQSWRSDLAEERVTVHKEARCYFSRGEDSKDIDQLAFCGPARHFAEEPDSDTAGQTGTDSPDSVGSGVWDTYTFESAAIEGGYQLIDPFAKAKGANVPAGAALFRPDGKTSPDDADKIAAPPPPSARAGFIGLTSTEEGTSQVSPVDTVKIEKPFKLDSAPVETPNRKYQLGAAGTTGRIKTREGTRVPAPNEVFLVGEFSASEGMWSDVYPEADDYRTWDDPFPKEKIVQVSGALTLVTATGRVALSFDGQGTLVVSVPKANMSASLEIAAGGRVQTISFTTGKVTDAAPEPLSAGLNVQYPTGKAHLDSVNPTYPTFVFDGTHTIRFVNASLTPFHPMKGWAAKNKMWLVLETTDVQDEFDLMFFDISPDFTNSTIVKAEGVTYRNVGEASGDRTDEGNKTVWPLFEVDQAVKTFRVTYQPIWRVTGKPQGINPSGTVKFKPMSFDVRFPG